MHKHREYRGQTTDPWKTGDAHSVTTADPYAPTRPYCRSRVPDARDFARYRPGRDLLR